MADGTFDGAKAAADAIAPNVQVRLEHRQGGEVLVYSAAGVDLLERAPGAGRCLCLRDYPRRNAEAGKTYDLSHEPFDEQCACAARDMAAGLEGR